MLLRLRCDYGPRYHLHFNVAFNLKECPSVTVSYGSLVREAGVCLGVRATYKDASTLSINCSWEVVLVMCPHLPCILNSSV